MRKFPDCFPENFESEILPRDAKCVKRHVYRIIKSGMINKSAFMSTFEEIKEGLIPPPKRLNLSNPSTYSTSCSLTYDDLTYWLDVFMRKGNPKAFIAEGETDEICGPNQITSDRDSSNSNKNHVDWWIYADSNPQDSFQEVLQYDD